MCRRVIIYWDGLWFHSAADVASITLESVVVNPASIVK